MVTNLLKAVLPLLGKVAIAVFVWSVLPQFGIHLHWGVLAASISVMAIATYFNYRAITATACGATTGQESLVGARGKVVTPLSPEGRIRLDGETWKASSVDRRLASGENVVVVRCHGLTLVVEPADCSD